MPMMSVVIVFVLQRLVGVARVIGFIAMQITNMSLHRLPRVRMLYAQCRRRRFNPFEGVRSLPTRKLTAV